MRTELLQAALDESLKFGPRARLVLTFPGNEDTLHIHPLAYNKIGPDGFRIEIRVSQFEDAEVVDDVVFVDAAAIESAELQVKQAGSVWQDEPYAGMGEEPD